MIHLIGKGWRSDSSHYSNEQMLKGSLFTVGRMSGLSDDQIELDWQRVKLEAQYSDIHIEEL